MELFHDTKIDFLGRRRLWIAVSLALNVVAIVVVFVQGRLNLGIDFAGGTQLTVRFADPPDVNRLRALIGGAGIGEAAIQSVGERGESEVIIKTPLAEGEGEGSRGRIEAALHQALNGGATGFDVNRQGADALADFLLAADPDRLRAADEAQAAAHYRTAAEAVATVRRSEGLIASWSALDGAGLSPEIRAALAGQATLGKFAVVGAENVGPQIGSELRRKGTWAVVLSLLAMLGYIWLRFELHFGIGALVASLHDVLIVLGLFTLAGFEFNLTTIAGFLTLVGYSVNDTVVTFDRVRENLRQNPRENLVDLMNRSINQTLSRTFLTGGTTLLATASLLFLGGEVLRGFAFILSVGVIVGTYSSIYIASPFALWWNSTFGRRGRSAKMAA
jgi:preprotein translocase subunit SecF